MNVNPVSEQAYLSLLLNPPAAGSQNSNPITSLDSASIGVTSSLSGPAQFFSELKQLAEQNPSQFKQITAEIAQQLTATAQSATNTGQAQELNALASRFQQASQTGDFSSLLPQQQSGATSGATSSATQGHHHGHHHRGGYSDTDSNSSTQNPLASIIASFGPQVQSALGTTTQT